MRELDTPASDSYNQRFGGTRRLYGNSEVEILRAAHVCVIGIGGVGSWAAEALARSGVGELTLIDMDDVCVTNINRQIHAMTGTVGQSKIEVMAARIHLINPECKVNLIDDFISPENQAEYLSKEFDYVLDAIDSLKAKASLLAYCKSNKIKVITIGGAGGQTDPTQIQVTDLTKTPKRKFGIDCVYSTEHLKYPQADGSVCAVKATADGPKRMDCASGFGAATVVTASFGFVAVAHIIKKLIEKYRQ